MFTLLFLSAYPAIFILDILLFFALIAVVSHEQFIVWLVGVAALTGVGLYYSPVALAAVMSNPLWLVLGFVSYFAVGVVYSIYKWWSFVDVEKMKEAFKEWKINYGKGYPNATEEELKKTFIESPRNPFYRVGYSLSNDNNWKIANWIVTWPFSLLIDFFRTFFVDLAKNLVRIFSGVYDRISKVSVDKL